MHIILLQNCQILNGRANVIFSVQNVPSGSAEAWEDFFRELYDQGLAAAETSLIVTDEEEVVTKITTAFSRVISGFSTHFIDRSKV